MGSTAYIESRNPSTGAQTGAASWSSAGRSKIKPSKQLGAIQLQCWLQKFIHIETVWPTTSYDAWKQFLKRDKWDGLPTG